MAREPAAPTRVAPEIGVTADPPADTELLRAAARLSVDLNLPFLKSPREPHQEMLLVVTRARVELRVLRGEAVVKGGKPLYADLGQVDATSPAGRTLQQPLAKALGIKKRSDPPISVIDATAGWGEDAWLMAAALGCRVLAVERNRVVQTLLRDGLLRMGAEHPEVLSRLSVVASDARHMLRRIARLREAGDDLTASKADALDDLPPQMRDFLAPAVVFLDPMFPGGRKAAERRPMKVLRRLVGDDGDSGELLDLALAVARQRVVVKRPMKAPPLGDRKPTTTHKGKSLRYDVYVPAPSRA